MGLEKIIDEIDEQSWLDTLGIPIQLGINNLFRTGGKAGMVFRDFLHGVWLKHPLHAVLTDVPIGAWTAAITLDMAEMATGEQAFGNGADAAVTLGIAGAAGSAVAGLTDWQHTTGRTRRVGLMHALLNTTALCLYIGSLISRKNKNRQAGWGLALIGYGVMAASAYLGGDMVYNQKMGVDHAPRSGLPEKYTPVMSLNDLPENTLTRGYVNHIPIVLLRRGKRVYAIAETCSHLGGPLSEGQLKDEDDSVVCPWHQSRFSMETGANIHGPSTYDQPAFETRVRNGQIEVKAVEPVE